MSCSTLALGLLLAFPAGCTVSRSPDRKEDVADSDADADTDTDSDADADTDTDSDADSDSDTDTVTDTTVDDDGDGYTATTDCDDGNPSVFPGASEVCNDLDDDCDGLIDGQDSDVSGATTWYSDDDGDGYGGPEDSITACNSPPGHLADASDCDDASYAVHPGATESCNHLDDDCDGLVDGTDPDVTGALTWYADADGDGLGDPTSAITACSQPGGYSWYGSDCDDTDATITTCGADTGTRTWTAALEASFTVSGASQVTVDPDQGWIVVPVYAAGAFAEVYSATDYSLLGTFVTGGRPNPVAVDTANDHFLVGSADDGTVTAVDRYTLAPVTNVGGFSNVQYLLYDEDLDRVYVFDHVTGVITALQGSDLSAVGDLTLEYGLRQASVGDGMLYAIGSSNVTVHAIDTATFTEVDSTNLAGSLYGAVYVPGSDRLYISAFSEDSVYVLAASTLTLLGELPFSAPYQLAVNHAAGIVGVAGYGDGVISFIDSASDSVVASVYACGTATDIVYDEGTDRWYVTCFSGPAIAVISLE